MIYFEGCSLLLRSSSILQINVLFSERPLIRKSLLIPIASDRRLKWSTPKFRCPFSNARSCCTEISASAASCSCVQPFSRRLPRAWRFKSNFISLKSNLSINYHRVFLPSSPFCRSIATIFKQRTHKKVFFCQFDVYLLINLFERHQYVLLCNTKTLDFLHFPQTAFFTIQRSKSNAIGI